MYKISELIGKRTITLQGAKNCGIILGAYFDKNLTRLKCFSVLEEESESTFFVEYKAFSSLTSDAAVVRSEGDLLAAPLVKVFDSPINLPAFNQDGQEKGVIRDIVLEGAEVVSFVTDSGEIEAGTLLSRSKSAAVFNDTGIPIKLKPVPKRRSAASGGVSRGVSAGSLVGGGAADGRLGRGSSRSLSTDGGGVDSADTDADGLGGVITRPYRAFAEGTVDTVAKYAFLLGKRLQRSVYSKDGKLVARENELVTEETIANAKENGMLVAVALHSL